MHFQSQNDQTFTVNLLSAIKENSSIFHRNWEKRMAPIDTLNKMTANAMVRQHCFFLVAERPFRYSDNCVTSSCRLVLGSPSLMQCISIPSESSMTELRDNLYKGYVCALFSVATYTIICTIPQGPFIFKKHRDDFILPQNLQ